MSTDRNYANGVEEPAKHAPAYELAEQQARAQFLLDNAADARQAREQARQKELQAQADADKQSAARDAEAAEAAARPKPAPVTYARQPSLIEKIAEKLGV
jgi:hypothetical protein